MNRATIIGNLTRDPDIRMTNSGVSVCTFTVAVQRRFANQNGEKVADFIPVVCWRGLAETCGRYLRKGSKVGVNGSIQTSNYEAADGTKRYVTEIVADEVEFLERIGASAAGADRMSAGPESRSAFGGEASAFGDAVDDTELPF